MAKWTIEIVNGGEQARSYALLADPPDVTLDGAPVPVLPAVCASFDYVEPGQARGATFSEAVEALCDWPTEVAPDLVIARAITFAVNPVARDLATIRPGASPRRSRPAPPTLTPSRSLPRSTFRPGRRWLWAWPS